MSKQSNLLIILILGGLIYFGLRNPFYYDRQFHYLTKTSNPSIKITLTVPRVYIGDKQFEFDPPLTREERIIENSSSEIEELKTIDDESFATRLIYHYSLTNISKPGDNPEWEKRMILEISFYKKDDLGQWDWIYTSTNKIDDIKGTDKPESNSLSWEDYKTKKEYGIHYDFTAK
ncbi:MAG: hypothetical protein JNM78_18175 [Cyclobacteriaceae bacterium]|nr:hypothetical protein [Cyclobacteriaceae bacterium]